MPVLGVDLDWTDLVDVRAVPWGGFWMAFQEDGADPNPWLVEVHPDGTVSRIGDYPDPPPEVASLNVVGTLDASGALYTEVGIESGGFSYESAVIRRTVGGASAIVHREGPDPFVSLRGPLVTGP